MNDTPGDPRPLLGLWLLLAACLLAAAYSALGAPGMFYDEAWLDQRGKRFVEPLRVGLHAPGAGTAWLFGRPFPIYALPYLGALKSQLLILPFFAFGATLATARLTTLCIGIAALGFTALWARRAFGGRTALVALPLIACDPSFFFSAQVEWGPFTSGFLCRAAGLWLLTVAWQERRRGYALAAGLVLGLGVYNRADFVLILGSLGLGILLFRPRLLLEVWQEWRWPALAGLGAFALTSSPMWLRAMDMFRTIGVLGDRGDLRERWQVLLATLDGSYFYRLMDQGGRFATLFEISSPRDLLIPAFLLAALGLLGSLAVDARARRDGRGPLVVAALLLSGLMLWLPGATRAHHMLNLMPFVQLVIALALVRAGEALRPRLGHTAASHAVVAALLAVVALSQLRVVHETRSLIAQSGGRGFWSNAIDQLAADLEAHPGAAAVSFDWGFHLQLLFLTQEPQLLEPFWKLQKRKPGQKPWRFQAGPHVHYLVHDEHYDRAGFSPHLLAAIRTLPEEIVEIRPYRDREGATAFLALRVKRPHDLYFDGRFRFRLN